MSELVKCTFLIVELLNVSFEKGKISYKEFEQHIKIKLPFLKKQVGYIDDDQERVQILELIKKCEKVMASYYCNIS